MSNYTTELRFICETLSGLDESKGYNSVNEIISGSRTKIFDFSYPIFDSAYKPTLETKILKHYYTREICAETYGRWKLFLDARLNEIMPRYNKLYESELLKFNPLYDVDYNRTGNKDSATTLDDTVTNTTDLTTLQTDNRTSTNTLSGADTRVIDNEIGGSDVRTIENEVGGSDVRTIENEIGGSDVRTIENEIGGSDVTVSENELGGSDRTVTNTEDGGDESVHRENVPKTDQWTYYSDTPQGGVDGMNLTQDMYLTNATHVTADASGSEDDSTTTFGKTVDTTGTTTYGRTSDTTDRTTYGKTDDTTDTTAYGKTDDTTDTTVYGRTNDTTDTLTYGKKTTDKDTGTTQKDTDGTTTSDRDSSENTSVDYAEHVIGKMPGKSYSKLLQEFRETFLNIDLMIINDLSDLFFGLWE